MFRPETPEQRERWDRLADAPVPAPPAPPAWTETTKTAGPAPADARELTAAERGAARLREWAARGGSPIARTCHICQAVETWDGTRSHLAHDQAKHEAHEARLRSTLDTAVLRRVASDDDVREVPAIASPPMRLLRRAFGGDDS